MVNDWMGRYADFCAALVRYANVAARNAYVKIKYPDYGFELTAQAWQVLEYLLTHSDESRNMTEISEALGIPVSSFSKHSQQLVKLGLLEKYRVKTNKKNIILKPTALAEKFYAETVNNMVGLVFQELFEHMETMTDEQLESLTKGIGALANGLETNGNDDCELIKIDDQ